MLLTLVPAPPGLPAVFVSVWASVRASLADTEYVGSPSPTVLWGQKLIANASKISVGTRIFENDNFPKRTRGVNTRTRLVHKIVNNPDQ